MKHKELRELAEHIADYILTHQEEWYLGHVIRRAVDDKNLAEVINRELIRHGLLDKEPDVFEREGPLVFRR